MDRIVILRLINTFNANPIKIPVGFFCTQWQKLIQKGKVTRKAQTEHILIPRYSKATVIKTVFVLVKGHREQKNRIYGAEMPNPPPPKTNNDLNP